jgi:hypothetical protein
VWHRDPGKENDPWSDHLTGFCSFRTAEKETLFRAEDKRENVCASGAAGSPQHKGSELSFAQDLAI